jgi:transposase
LNAPNHNPWSLKDVDALRERLRGLAAEGKFDDAIEILLELLVHVRDDNTALRVRLHNALREIYGRKSEKVSLAQLELALDRLDDVPDSTRGQGDGEAEADADEQADTEPDSGATDPDEGATVPKPKRKPKKLQPKRGKLALPPDLPREMKTITVPDDARTCTQCGAEKKTIGYAETETLEFVPAHFKIVVERLEKVACPECEAHVEQASSQKVMDSGLPGPALLAHVLVSKSQDSQPLYRQSDIMKRSGVRIPDSTLGDWFAFAADVIGPLAAMISARVLSSYVLNADDTGLRVLDRKALNGVKRGHIWGFVGDGHYVYFHYAPNWKPIHPAKLLSGFEGYVQGDGYAGYSAALGAPNEPAPLVADDKRLGCGMHIRRKFQEALDAGDARAAIAIAYFRKLYTLEARYKQDELNHHERKKRREDLSKPVVADFFAWADEAIETAVPKTPLYRALTYARNQREYFERCFTDGRFEIDNGAVEREFRRVRLGEKNFLFAGSDKGAERIAIVWTVVATCRLHGVDPEAYLADVLFKIQNGWLKSRIDELMPETWQKLHSAKATTSTPVPASH